MIQLLKNNFPGLSGITQYTPAELSKMSQANLIAIMSDAQSEIDYITRELQNPNISEDTKNGMRSNLLQYQAIVAAIQAWLNLTPKQQAGTDGGNFIRTKQTQYIQSFNKGINYITAPGTDTSGFNILDTISANYAGLPLYLWLGIAAGGLYFFLK
jgi:hypothetical protein